MKPHFHQPNQNAHLLKKRKRKKQTTKIQRNRTLSMLLVGREKHTDTREAFQKRGNRNTKRHTSVLMLIHPKSAELTCYRETCTYYRETSILQQHYSHSPSGEISPTVPQQRNRQKSGIGTQWSFT